MKSNSNIDIVITGNVAWLDISWTPKILYGLIRGLTRNDNYCCYATNAYLAAKLGVENDSTIRRYLSQLRSLDVIYSTDGYIVAENGKIVFRQRLIVLTELRKKFEQKQELLRDLHDKSRKKNVVRACNSARVQACNSAHLNINKELPCEEINISINKKRDTPLPPSEGVQKDSRPPQSELRSGEQRLVFGSYQNVRLTEQQKDELVRWVGSEFALSLIEQLSCYIQSKQRRFRRNADHFAILQDWALRRLEPKSTLQTIYVDDNKGDTVL